jgi:hypothetical protein
VIGDTVAAGAFDGTRLAGRIDRGGRAVIKVSSGHIDGTRVHRYEWEFRQIQVRCAGKWLAARLPVTGGFAANVRYDEIGQPWGIDGAASGNLHHPSCATRVSGRLYRRSGRKAGSGCMDRTCP